MTRILVACFGNPLRGDDGFGPAVAARLAALDPPPAVSVMDVGIGGIHLVQELLTPADALVVVDAVDLGREPGTVLVQRPDVEDLSGLSPVELRERLVDTHYATPARALMLAGALSVLPAAAWLVGCQRAEVDELGEGLCPPVAAAVSTAVEEVRRLVRACGVAWG